MSRRSGNFRKEARRIAGGVKRRARRAAGRVRRRWRRSLQLRVVTSTLLVSALVVTVLAFFLMDQIKTGMAESRRNAVLAEAGANKLVAEQLIEDAQSAELAEHRDRDKNKSTSPEQPDVTELPPRSKGEILHRIVDALARRAGPTGQGSSSSMISRPGAVSSYEVIGIYLRDQLVWPQLSRGIEISSITPDIREKTINGDAEHHYVKNTQLRYANGQTVPGIVVGDVVSGDYAIYHLFPLNQEEETLAFVQRTLIGVGAALVMLIAAIAYLVTRQVVTPVRLARQSSERLAAGDLEERMRVKGEDDLARLASSFNEMAENLAEKIRQLEQLSQAQRQFASDVSHELRTPVTTIRMAADLLYESRDDLDPAIQRPVELLQNQLERFESMLTDLLEISRYDSRAATLDPDPIDVREIVMRAVGDAESLAEATSTKLVLRLPGEACMAELEALRIERILRNLVVNAIEHGEGNDVVITMAADRDSVAIAVRDHGIGLKDGQETKVFERFWRADPARARTTGGTGLGLAISREDAQLHGGWLQAWGAPGDGSNFRLTLPREAGAVLKGSPLPLVPPEVEMRRQWRTAAPVGGPQ